MTAARTAGRDRRAAARRTSPPSRPPPSVSRGVILHTPLVAFGPPEARSVPEGRVAAAHRRLQAAWRVCRDRLAVRQADRARGVITYSSGNHAQGVARAARLLGAPAVVVMPSDAPAIKRERVAADGAEIVTVGTASDERQAVAERLAAERGLAIIPPYDDDRIIAGQGTVGLEIVADLPDVAAVLVPIGGGGLACGVAAAIRALRPDAASSASSPSSRPTPATRSSAARSSAGPPTSFRARSRTARARRRSASARSRTCAPTSIRSSRSARPRSRPASGSPPSGRASSPSLRERSAIAAARVPRPGGRSGSTRRSGRRRGQRRERRPGAVPRIPRRRRCRPRAEIPLYRGPIRASRPARPRAVPRDAARGSGSVPSRRRRGGPPGQSHALRPSSSRPRPRGSR